MTQGSTGKNKVTGKTRTASTKARVSPAADDPATVSRKKPKSEDTAPSRRARSTADSDSGSTARRSATDGKNQPQKSLTKAGRKPAAAEPRVARKPAGAPRSSPETPSAPDPRTLALEALRRCAAVTRGSRKEPALPDAASESSSEPAVRDAFPAIFGELDLYLSAQGTHQRLYEKMGAHPHTLDGVQGTTFAVWAPNASAVSVIGDFNNWDGRVNPMKPLGDSGIWYTFVPGIAPGHLYKYEIRTRAGHLRIKADPFAFAGELRPRSASMVWNTDAYQWNDSEWMESRARQDLRTSPMAVYEVHLGSWMRAPEDDHRWLNYREIAHRLADHVRRYNFTHVELLPVAEHPLDQSWGYQVTGYYSPTARHGTPDDFKYLVDVLHQAGIGVILDWVPAHFPKDDTALRWFDGTSLYEHADPRQGEHTDWGTLIFNYGRHEVRNFLLANALFWLDKYHIDGLRVDAVASMLYLDYSRKDGEWIPNEYGGRENLAAIDFVRRMNELVYGTFPGTFTIAEESTDWGGVTMPTYLGGLGFGFKWDMGWMNDTLRYFSKDPVHRAYHHNDLTFGMLYAYSENFILPLSHDEVVHEKGSLLSKMPGDEWQRFANLRALYTYMYTRPGKKLLFMGSEFAMGDEWKCDHSIDWHLTQYPLHKGVEILMEDLGRLYRSRDCLWAWDAEPRGFQWIDCSDSTSSVISYVRRGPQSSLVVAMNLTPVPRVGYRVGVPHPGFYREVVNTDSEVYGGGNLGNNGGLVAEEVPCHGHQWSLNLTLPPLACVVLEPDQ